MAIATTKDVEKAVEALPGVIGWSTPKTAEDAERAGATLLEVKRRLNLLKAEKKRLIDPVVQHKRDLEALFEPLEFQLSEAEKGLKRAIAQFHANQEAERRRLEAEERDRHASEQAEAEAAAKALEAKGEKWQAEATRDNVRPTPLVVMDTPKIDGISIRDQWHAEVVDLMELVKAVAAGTVPLHYLQANTANLNLAAKQMKGTGDIPGVRLWNDKGVAVRA